MREIVEFRPPATAHRQDISVERLLWWTYREQAAHAQAGRGWGGPAGYRGSGLALVKLAALGRRIDTSWVASQSVTPIDPDAERVHAGVLDLGGDAVGLIIHHARTAGRPDWMPGAVPRLVPLRRANGRARIEYHDAAKRRPSHCPLAWSPHPDEIAFARRVWEIWAGGLARLAGGMGTLERWAVTAETPPLRPWEKEGG